MIFSHNVIKNVESNCFPHRANYGSQHYCDSIRFLFQIELHAFFSKRIIVFNILLDEVLSISG